MVETGGLLITYSFIIIIIIIIIITIIIIFEVLDSLGCGQTSLSSDFL